MSALILGAGVAARSPIVDAVSLANPVGASLSKPLWYSALAPLSDLLDGLTLLSLPQILCAFGFGCALAAVYRRRVSIRRMAQGLPPLPGGAHLRFATTVFGAIVAISGLGLVTPRPMAALHLRDPDLLAVDFHSHTSASHDGRAEFTPEANREWHRRAGFDVAYVSDHHTFAGAREGARLNPGLSGENTVLLPALEYRDDDEHVIALGLDPATTDPERREWHPLYPPSGATTADRTDPPALLILSLPGDVRRVPADEEIGIARLAGIELSDGSPRGIRQAEEDRSAIIALARKLNISLVAGSDNHGWGRTAAAWSVMRIPGWRKMTPPDLDAAIRQAIASRRGAAVQVVARTRPAAASAVAVALTGPKLAWEIARDIGWAERASWVAWIWLGWIILAAGERRRTLRGPHLEWVLPEIDPEGSPDGLLARQRAG